MPVLNRTQLADAAIVYAEADVKIIPLWWPVEVDRCACPLGAHCSDKGKHPLTPNGAKDASADPDVVEARWTRWPQANVGQVMTEDVFAIDIDPRNGGDTTWATLVNNAASLCRADDDRRPDGNVEDGLSTIGQIFTRTSLSGRGDGGRHHWLSRPDIKMRGKLGPGVDVKSSTNSYVLVPPSIHYATMAPYTWLDPATPIAVPPNWLVEVLRAPEKKTCGSTARFSFGRWNASGLLRVMSGAKEGRRNDVLFWCACRVGDDVASGTASERQALKFLEALAGAAESTGLSTHEVDATIRSGYCR